MSRPKDRPDDPTTSRWDRSGIFGGVSMDELVAAIGNGYATWVDTDDDDVHPTVIQGAMVARAPIATVYDTVVDFENAHRFVGVARRNKILKRTDTHIKVRLRQGIGLGPFSLGLSELFRFRFEPPVAVHCEAYLDGPFKEASIDWFFFELGDDLTLVVMAFLCDVRELGGFVIKKFFQHHSELAFTVSSNVVIVPLTSYVAEVERRAGPSQANPMTTAPPLPETLAAGKLTPALRHGLLTLGRLDDAAEIVDIACATRIGASPEEVWPAVEDPRVLTNVISFVSKGRLHKKTSTELHQELEYRIRFGPLKRRYRFSRHAEYEAPCRMGTIKAELGGQPVRQSEYLWEDGRDTRLCQVHYYDLKKDWLTDLFLRRHAEFERLIATYSPHLFVRSVRLLYGPPRDV